MKAAFLTGVVLCACVAGADQSEIARWDPNMAVVNAVVDTNGVKWIDGQYLPLEGRAFNDTAAYYDRLPANVTTNVNEGVRSMKSHTSGMMFRFRTDSQWLHFRWVPTSENLSMDHMPSTGVSGIDVYRFDKQRGKWLYVKTGRITSAKGGALNIGWKPGDACLVNLPLYNGVRSFQLGIQPAAKIEALGPRASGIEKPVVFYGTSITHGGCCSRPGLGFVNIVGRDLDVPVVGLGFSGSGVMEFEMSEHLAKIDASCYVLDCLWNMNSNPKNPNGRSVERNYEPFIRNLRAKRPGVPIVMAEMCDVYCKGLNGKDTFIKGLYEKLVAEGWSNLVYLPKDAMYAGDFEGTVDGVHPNDLGMMTMAKAFGKAVRAALAPVPACGLKTVRTGGMSESPYVEKTVETIVKEGLGDYTVLFVGPWTGERIRKVGDYCREHKMTFVMDELVNRLTGKVRSTYRDHLPGVLEALKEYPDVFGGSLLLCEFGGLMFNWPESTVHNAATKPPPAETFSACAANTVECMKKTIATAQEMGIPRPYICIEPTGGAAPSAVYRAGIDRIDLEVVYNDDLERRYASVVGATKAFGKTEFGVDMAMVWYGGNQHDRLWESRWRTSLFHAFLRGADPIYTEHGLMNYEALGKKYGTDHPDVKRFRRCVADIAAFAQAHPRPVGLPLAAVAAVTGRNDGYAGGWQTHLWGQRTDDRYRMGDADYAWEIFDSIYRRRGWENREKFGDIDYSGNPPLGAADILPYDAPQANFNGYQFLFFLGRNYMDDALYAKLVAYVRQGGTLLLSAAHLNAADRPTDPFIPYNGGDWSELTGLRTVGGVTNMAYGLKFCAEPPCGWRLPLWSANCDPKYTDGGFAIPRFENLSAEVLAVSSDRFVDGDFKPDMLPVLYAKKIGKGTVVFLPTTEPIGGHNVKYLYEALVKSGLEAVDVWPKVQCSDRVRFAVYPGRLFLLNTESDLAASVEVRTAPDAKAVRLTLAPGEMTELAL